MPNQTLLGALPILAKFLGRKLGVQVRVGGNCARTDSKIIVLPALPENESAHVLAHGYLDHEGAHVRYTDFSAPKPASPLGKALVNILEDIRIEKELGQALPGSRKNLERLVSQLVAQGNFWQVPEAQDHPARKLQAYLLFRLRASVLGQSAIQPLADQAEALLRQTLPVEAMTRLAALAFEVNDAQSTQAVCDLAQRILQMFEQMCEEEQPLVEKPAVDQAPSDPSTADHKDQATPSESDQATPSESDQEMQSYPNPEIPNDHDREMRNSLNTADDGEDLLSEEGEDQQARVDPIRRTCDSDEVSTDEVLRAILEAGSADLDARLEDLGQQLEQQLNQLACDEEDAAVMAEFDPVPAAPNAVTCSQTVRAATVALRRRLAGLVQSSRQDGQRRVRHGRHLACKALYRLACRDAGIFVKKTRREAPDTAVYLLLDRSGSMGGNLISVASQATLATAMALEEIPGCQAAVLAFPGSTDERVVPLLGFTERATTVAGRFQLSVTGGTPMANAMWRAAYELLRRPETRRIMMVVTDGAPNYRSPTEAIIQRCRQSGIEVFGLGILIEAPVLTLFGAQHAVVITNIRELPKALFRLLERSLIPG